MIDEEKTGFSWGRDLSYNLILALLYFLGGKFSFSFFYQDKIVTLTAFLPEGFALAAVLIYGPRILPGIVLGQFALALDAGLQLIPALGVALVNGIEALLAAFLARYLHFDIQLRRVRDILILTVLIFFVLQPFSSLLGNGVLYLAHETHNHYFHADLFYWWFGNSMGQILLTPLLLTLYTWHPRPNYLLLGLIATATVLLNYLLQILLGVHNLALLMLITLPLLIHLSTIDLRYALTAAVTLDLSSLLMIHYGRGVFVQAPTLQDKLLNLNFFILSTILLVLIVGTLFREKEEAIRELQSAHFDPLTGTLNRRHLDRKIRESLQDVQELQTISALCYLDLDRFKIINDTYGHGAGDQVLKEITHRVKHLLREYDELIRLGGDEFILILNHLHRVEELQKILDRILQTLAKPLYIDGEIFQVTASIGAVLITPELQNPEELLRMADMTMYQAKKEGRNRYFIAQREFRRDQRSIAKP